jgi:hypothetical protein
MYDDTVQIAIQFNLKVVALIEIDIEERKSILIMSKPFNNTI